MTHLRKMMLEELQRRHYSESTTRRDIRFIERFAKHFHCSPDRLGPQHIREYQAQLFTVRKLTPGTVTNGGPESVLQYLGRYTHRVAISNHRLVALTDDQVTFRWRDSAEHNRQKVMTVSRDEFLRRFLLHLFPKGFVRIRHFGFLANRRRATLLPQCFAALHALPPQAQSEPSTASTTQPLWRCPKCGGPMVVAERFTAAQLQLRSPPLLAKAA